MDIKSKAALAAKFPALAKGRAEFLKLVAEGKE